MEIIAIILSLIVTGAICSGILLFLYNKKQKKISDEVSRMIEDINKRKKEISSFDQKLTIALGYLSKMQPLDHALEMEEKIKLLRQDSDTQSSGIVSVEEKLKVIQEQVQNYKSTRSEKINETASVAKVSAKGTQEATPSEEKILDSMGEEINLKALADKIEEFVQKNDSIDSSKKQSLNEAKDTLAKIDGQLRSLMQIYSTYSKRVSGLDTQYQELQQEYQRLLAKSEEAAAAAAQQGEQKVQ